MSVKGNSELVTTVIAPPIQTESSEHFRVPPVLPSSSTASTSRAGITFVTGTGVPMQSLGGKFRTQQFDQNTDTIETPVSTTHPSCGMKRHNITLLRPSGTAGAEVGGTMLTDPIVETEKFTSRTYPYTYICRNNVTAYMHMLQLLLNEATRLTAAATTTLSKPNLYYRRTSAFPNNMDMKQEDKNTDENSLLTTVEALVDSPLYHSFKRRNHIGNQQQQLPFPILLVHINGISLKTIQTFFRNVLHLLVISPQKPFVVSASKQSFGSIGD